MTLTTIIWVLILTYPGYSGVQRTEIEFLTSRAGWAAYKEFRKDTRLHTTECWWVEKQTDREASA